MFEYKTVVGNALDYKFNPPGKVLIPHVVNTIGIMGSGAAYFIKKKWPQAESEYTDWYNYDAYNIKRIIAYDETQKESWESWYKHRFELGEVQFVEVEDDIFVANMVGQKNVGENEFGMPPIRMDSLKECLYRLRKFIIENKIDSVASVKFGSLRAGGCWTTIEELIQELFADVDVQWFTYEFKEK